MAPPGGLFEEGFQGGENDGRRVLACDQVPFVELFHQGFIPRELLGREGKGEPFGDLKRYGSRVLGECAQGWGGRGCGCGGAWGSGARAGLGRKRGGGIGGLGPDGFRHGQSVRFFWSARCVRFARRAGMVEARFGGVGLRQELLLNGRLPRGPGCIPVQLDLLFQILAPHLASLIDPGPDGPGSGHLDDLTGFGVADGSVFQDSSQFRKFFQAPRQLQKVARSGLGKPQLVTGVLVHAGEAQVLVELPGVDVSKPEDGAVFSQMHSIHRSLKGTMGLRGRLAGAKSDS